MLVVVAVVQGNKPIAILRGPKSGFSEISSIGHIVNGRGGGSFLNQLRLDCDARHGRQTELCGPMGRAGVLRGGVLLP